MELWLGGEVQVFRSDDGARKSGVDGLKVRLLDSPFLRSQIDDKTGIDHRCCPRSRNSMAARRCNTFLRVHYFLYERS